MIVFSSYKKNVARVWFQVVNGVCFTEKKRSNLPKELQSEGFQFNVKPSDFRYNDYKYLVILCAAVTQPVSKSLLKYSTVYPIRGDCPVLELRLHDIVTEVDRRSTIFGFVGG